MKLSDEQIKAMTTDELMSYLLVNDDSDRPIKNELLRRREKDRGNNGHPVAAQNGAATQVVDGSHRAAERSAVGVAPLGAASPFLENNRTNFPWREEEPVVEWMQKTTPALFAARIKNEGFAGQGMRDPHDAMGWLATAIYANTQWNELNLEATRFWKAMYTKYNRWMALGKPKDMTP